MSAEMLAAIAGALLSLLFSYVPGLSDWYASLGAAQNDQGTRKRLVMLGLLALVAAGSFGLSCAGWGTGYGLELSCDQQGVMGLLQALLLAAMANQATHRLTPHD
ncbi:MAG: hypothetical protein GYA34_07295 [Chloroflexi bacterium]|nr:hypothetical protein [Chloroflexota bacterium]